MTGRVLGRCGYSSDSWSCGGCPDLRTSERQPRLTTRGAPGNRHPTPGVLEPPSVGEVAGGRAGGAAFLLFLASWSGDGLVLREDPPRSQLPLQEGREVVPGGNGDQHRGGLGPHHSAQRAITRGFSLIRSHSALTCAPFSPGSVLTQSTRLSRSRLVSSGAEDPPTKEAKLVSPSKPGAAYELGGPTTHHARRVLPGMPHLRAEPKTAGQEGSPRVSENIRSPGGQHWALGSAPAFQGSHIPPICSFPSRPLRCWPQGSSEQNSLPLSFRQQPVLPENIASRWVRSADKVSKSHYGAPHLSKHLSYLEKSEVCEEQAAGRVGAPGHRGHLVSCRENDEDF